METKKLSRFNLIFIALVLILIIGGFWGYQKFFSQHQVKADQLLEEIELTFDPEGSYALAFPRRDGNALLLNIKRTGSYDAFAYQISYSDEEGIGRGAGSLDTWIKLPKDKGDFEQEILFGSCSTGGTCVYDKGVKNGTLALNIRKGNKVYKMSTAWRLQKPDIELGKLYSEDAHFAYEIDPKSVDLSLVKFTIINDLTGAPKLSSDKSFMGKVYALNTPQAKSLPEGKVTMELAENAPEGSKIAKFDEAKNQWIEFDTKIEGSKLTTTANGSGIFAVLTASK